MQDNENNDGVMDDDVTNLPEGDADAQGTDGRDGGSAGDGVEGDEAGDGESKTEGSDGETGNGDMEDGESVGDVDMDGNGDMMIGGDDMMNIGGMDGMMGGDMGDLGTETGVKDPILSSIPFVAGTISAALVVGIVLGILLGKKRIKKGFELYEN